MMIGGIANSYQVFIRAKRHGEMHTMSPRLGWAQLIPASDSSGGLQDAKCSTSEELINIEYAMNTQRLALSYNMAMFTLAPSHVPQSCPA